jgi:hypothetical protein
MAGDWIKMRTDLYRDPKVVMIADFLGAVDGPLDRQVSQQLQANMAITRNALRCATVGALVALWGVTRHRGKRYGDDLVLHDAPLRVVDEISELPGFGAAMASVGWIRETDKGLVFPNFFEEFNSDPLEDAKAKAAERQRRYREKHKQNSNVTVTSQSDAREEKSRGEKIHMVHGARTRKAEGKTKITVQASDIRQAALAIFDGCGYRGNQGGNLWKVAALQESGIISEGEVASACRGAELNGKDKPAHFYTCLKEALSKRGADLGALLKGVRIEPQWPKSPPSADRSGVRLQRVQTERAKTPEEVLRELAACTRDQEGDL